MKRGISVGIVLAVGVERHDRGAAVVERAAEARSQRGALALVRALARSRSAPAASAFAAVSSVEPSSTTTTGRWRRVGLDDRRDPGPSS